jgi:hypothetical protein
MSLPSGSDVDAGDFDFGPAEALAVGSVWPGLSDLVGKGVFVD